MDGIVLNLECGHRILVSREEGRKARIGTLAFCGNCRDLSIIKSKTQV
jgi:hypothetical protein